MKILIKYLEPYKWIVALALLLAAINQSFSMLDPYFFGTMGLDHLANHPYEYGKFVIHGNQKVWQKTGPRTQSQFIWDVIKFLTILISVAMVSRIAKAF
jgi:ATP-binding cassette subfamily B protein